MQSIIKDYLPVDGTSIRIPYAIITGTSPGPRLLITAGIHCAEFVGIQAAIELLNEIDPQTLRGSVTIIPLANRSGFEHRTMSTVFEDGKNLNRVFPGDSSGTAAERLAYVLFNSFIRNADAYIDLHCGDGFEELVPYVYYLGDTEATGRSKAMASCADTHFCVRSRCRTGGAYNLASVSGIPSVLIERGQLSETPRDLIDQDKEDILNIMRFLGMADGTHIIHDKSELDEYEMFAPVSGCWYPRLHPGDIFRYGDTLGEIKDYFGVTLIEITAPQDGIMLHQCAHLNIIEDGPMISFGIQRTF